jgi:hypothetical protein
MAITSSKAARIRIVFFGEGILSKGCNATKELFFKAFACMFLTF